jgi:predicted Holliday junction resolvase-like endonuclease
MEVFIVTLALLGLLLFLALKHKQNQDTKRILDQAADHSLELQSKLAAAEERATQIDTLQAELSGYRQATAGMVSSKEHQLRTAELTVVKAVLEKTKAELETVKGKQISERVRLGQVSENLIPFLGGFPYNPKNVRGIFQPIDLLVFNDEEIVFVEVKTGDAKLTEKQRNIKRLIEEGKVRFEVHMLKDSGYEIK